MTRRDENISVAREFVAAMSAAGIEPPFFSFNAPSPRAFGWELMELSLEAGQRFALGSDGEAHWWHEHRTWVTDAVYPPTYHCTRYALEELPQLDEFDPKLVRAALARHLAAAGIQSGGAAGT